MAWARIGLQSFGGGTAVQFYAYRDFVDRTRLLTPSEWAEAWGLCQVVPGMNLVALAALIGSRTAGTAGVAASVLGLLLPSVVITGLVSAAYVLLKDTPLISSAMHGVVAAAVGIGLLNTWRLARPILAAASGVLRAGAVALLVAAALLMAIAGPPVFAVLIGAGLVMGGLTWAVREPRS